ncbi:MAG TPA: HEAT repeat domain-containing protein [Candidatus Polarisedimenticolaceae bacterium]|nr:HEAT repeat domain-containing protein [Candidatus Polarisedimenticolaceae bacterium]
MHRVLIVTVLILAGVFLGLTTLILLNKLWRETRDNWRRGRARELEPRVLAWAHGETASLIAALGGMPARNERRVLEQILLDHVQRVRGIERDRLGRAYDELGYVDEHLRALRGRRWWRRADAAEKLGLAGATRAVDALAAALQDEVPEVRMRAAKSLGLLGGHASVQQLVHALNEPNRWSTIRVADVLTGMGRQVVDELIASFPELSLAGRLACLDILGRIRPLHVAPWLVERLGDREADVRARACHALGSIGDPQTAPDLVEALDDPDWPVRAMAAKSLGRIRQLDSIPALARTLRDREWWVRCNAARALRAMGAPGLEALDRLLEDPDRFARHQAVLMLEEAGVVDERAAALGGDGPSRTAALSFVRRVVDSGQVGRLRALAAGHADARVRASLDGLLPPEAAS